LKDLLKYKVESPLATRFSSYTSLDLSIFTRHDIWYDGSQIGCRLIHVFLNWTAENMSPNSQKKKNMWPNRNMDLS